MSAPETHEQDKTHDLVGDLMARGWGHFLFADAAHEYETRFAYAIRQGHAFDWEPTLNAYKIAATAFTIAYIEYNKPIQYDILHPKNRPTFAPPAQAYDDRQEGFTIGQGAGLAELRFTFNGPQTTDPGTPEAITRALVKTLKWMQPSMFAALRYVQPVLAGEGFTGKPLRPMSIFHMPINERLTLEILVAQPEGTSWNEPISLRANAMCQFGLVVSDPDGDIARMVEFPPKRAFLRKKVSPKALWENTFHTAPRGAVSCWTHIDLPDGITADDADAIVTEIYGGEMSDMDTPYATRFKTLVYGIIPIQNGATAPKHLRLVFHLTQSEKGASLRTQRAIRQRVKPRNDLKGFVTRDFPIPPPRPQET